MPDSGNALNHWFIGKCNVRISEGVRVLQDGPSNPVPAPGAGLVDRWLRQRHLREVTYVGLALLNVHSLTNAFLMPDIVWLTIILRLFILTPAALLSLLHAKSISSAVHEQIALFFVLTTIASEIVFFWMTKSQLGNYAFSEFGLTLVYGNMLMALRFRHAVVFTALSFLLACIAVWQKPLMDDQLRLALVVQVAMACIISLYANYKTECRRCRDYVVAHLAVTRALQSEAAKQSFEDQSITDALTGLPNRRLLDDRMKTLFKTDAQVAVMMIDVDYFKLFNDTLGHPAGDDCLRQIGAVIGAAQTCDVLCARYGGEEFAMVVQSVDRMEVERMAKALVRSIEALRIPHPGRPEGERIVTISVGVALKPSGRAAIPQDVFAAADRSLYRAKRMGRNCFVLNEPPHCIGTVAA